MTDDELKQLVASLAIAQQKTETLIQDLAMSQKDLAISQQELAEATDKQLKEISISQKVTDKQLKELGKQIGGLGEKFGSFTEGMAFPSMRKVLREQFGMEAITTRYEVKRNGKNLELDILAHSNGLDQKAVIVEVKSHLRDEYITRLLTILQEVKQYLPEHASKKFYGILAVVDAPEHLKTQVIHHGLYYAEIHDNVFSLKVPSEFQAQAF